MSSQLYYAYLELGEKMTSEMKTVTAKYIERDSLNSHRLMKKLKYDFGTMR